MRELILAKLREIKTNSKPGWIIVFEGQQLHMSSGKRGWGSIGAAKNALRLTLNRFPLEEIKRLENEGVITYREVHI